MINFLDTSAVLHNGLKNFQNVYISPLTLIELEGIKNSNKPDSIKYIARQAVHTIINNPEIKTTKFSQHRIEKMLHKYKYLSDINDHKIICEAELIGEKEDCKIDFYTYDAAQYLFAREMPFINAIYIKNEEGTREEVEYCGWSKHYPSNEQLSLLYTDPKMNTLNCKINEYAEIFVDQELKDILRWNGEEYVPIRYKDIKNTYLGETIKPRNLEQKMAFDLLQNQNIKVKLLMSAWGGGKTLLALNYALEQVSRGIYQKIVFVRNNIIAAGTNDIGYLPGDVRSKLSIFTRCIADHVGGEEKLEEMMDDRLIEAVPLSHIRGRSIRDSIVICDECENMDDKLVTLLMSRIEENSELIFCGDVAQIDSKRFEEHNGIRSMLKNLAGDPLFGVVKLIKSERGPVGKLCDKMIPPI